MSGIEIMKVYHELVSEEDYHYVSADEDDDTIMRDMEQIQISDETIHSAEPEKTPPVEADAAVDNEKQIQINLVREFLGVDQDTAIAYLMVFICINLFILLIVFTTEI